MTKVQFQLWIVGKVSNSENYKEWEFQGIFEDKQKAINTCETELYFIAPAQLNKTIPQKPQPWPGAYYPKGI
jgi:hypothetical protein